ncbi:hypothetical protein [Pseudoramibacter alactolyticus]
MEANPNESQQTAVERAAGRRQLILASAIGMGATAVCAVLVVMPQALALAAPIKMALALAGVTAYLAGSLAAAEIDRRVGCFECPVCHHRFTPTRGAYLKAVYGLTSRRLVCPVCGRRSRCAHRLTKDQCSQHRDELVK